MARSTKLRLEIAVYAITIAALLAVFALALGLRDGVATTTSMLTSFFGVFIAIAVTRRRAGRRDHTNLSIKDELALRKLRAQGPRVQFRCD